MSKRLQVLLEEAEYREIRRHARQDQMTVAEWVRQVLRAARREHPDEDPGQKLSAVHAAAQHDFPAPDLEQMLAEIERGYATKK